MITSGFSKICYQKNNNKMIKRIMVDFISSIFTLQASWRLPSAVGIIGDVLPSDLIADTLTVLYHYSNVDNGGHYVTSLIML